MNREEHIASMIQFVRLQLGGSLLPGGETTLVLGIWDLLDEAIEEEVREAVAWYCVERLRKVSVN